MPINLEQRPIFVIGGERSGTTLIMSILGCHPKIAVPEVAWYYPRFRPYIHTYGDLSDIENLGTLCEEMAYGLKTPFWDMDVNPATFGQEITEAANEKEPSFAGAYCAMLDRFAQEMGKPRWGEKTPYNMFYMKEILEEFPNAQFIFITRDGRDASADYLESSFGPTNIYCAAKLWNMGQDAVKPFRKSLPADQWYEVLYEDFVTEPEKYLRDICSYINEEYTDELLNFHQTKIAQRRGQTKDHAPLGSPVSDKYVGIYKNLLSKRDQGIFAWVAGENAAELGYKDLAEKEILSDFQIKYYEELDGRYRAVTLEAPEGHLVIDSYYDWLADQRASRKASGKWLPIPDPAPFPLGHEMEEVLTGARAWRKWKDKFSIKRQYYTTDVVL